MSEALELALDQLFNSRRLDPELLADDAEWVNPHDAVEPGTRRGADEFNRAIASVFATWDDVHFDTDRTIDNGDQVIALGSLHGHLHASGMVVSAEPRWEGGAHAVVQHAPRSLGSSGRSGVACASAWI